MDLAVRKGLLDSEQLHESQQNISAKVDELGQRYLKDNVKWIANALTSNNFTNCKQRLVDVIERCRSIGLKISEVDEASYIASLKEEYERVVRAALAREEQARIKAQIREEQQREREMQRTLKEAQREQEMAQMLLQKALAEAHGQYSQEVEELKAKLAEAEAKAQRTLSQAQLTKAGHVYVISNVGSFGEGIFKIGMTRRLEPYDRIRELGDASVPFPFDVHMMISCDDAPSLENAIHRKLHKLRINKINPRKEFFRTSIEAICDIVKAHHGDVEFIADAEALEFNQSLGMSNDDQEYLDDVFRIDDEELEDSYVGDEA